MRALARWGWVVVLALQVVVFGLGLPVWLAGMQQPCSDTALACQQQLRLSAAEATALEGLGWSLQSYAVYNLITRTLTRVLGIALGMLIFRRRRDDWMAYVASLFLVIGIETAVAASLAAAQPAWWLPTQALGYIGGMCFALFFYLFPSGQFVPRWTRWPAVGWAVVSGITTFFPRSPLSLTQMGPAAAAPVAFLIFGSFIVAQVYRYRAVSNAVERLQTKWVVFATVVSLSAFLLAVLPVALSGGETSFTQFWPLPDIGFGLAPIVVPLAIALAVLRHRLWDIDVIIRRTLVYSVLTGLLAVVYFSSVVVLQSALRGVVGGEAPVAIVLSTLLIAALFVPVRVRVQRAIDRRFFRRKYDAARVIAAFGVNLRDETDLGRLSERLRGVVEETMQPASVALWLRPATRREGT